MLYINETKYSIIFLATLILFLLIDLGQFFMVGTPIIPLLLSFYCIFVVHNPTYRAIGFISFLLGLEYFCFYNSFYLACTTLIPISVIGIFFRRNLYHSYGHPIMLALMAACIETYAIEGYFLHIWPSSHYTIMRISGTLLVAICFSLTINIWGVQDNRA